MIFPKLYPKIEIKEKSNEQRIKELEDMVNLLMKEKMVNVYFLPTRVAMPTAPSHRGCGWKHKAGARVGNRRVFVLARIH